MGSRGEAQVGGLGTNPVGDMGNEVVKRLTFFAQNTSIISYFNKVGLLIFPFWTPHLDVNFGRLSYTVTLTVTRRPTSTETTSTSVANNPDSSLSFS